MNMNTSSNQGIVTLARKLTLGVVYGLMFAAMLTAQEKVPVKPAEDEPIQMEAVSVTGSNIKRLEMENVLPVSLFSAEMIKARDSATNMDLLIGIPQVTNIPQNETSTNASAARGDNANVALRGLGSFSTLVLLNGRRTPVHPNNTTSVNVNTLPTFGIAQVEVLRDGASSIYGSDAVAGVVNYVTERKPHGTQTSVRWGVTQHGGGMDIDVKLGYGVTFAEDKGSWLINVGGYYRDAIFLRERAFTANTNRIAYARPPWNVPGSAYDGSTSNGLYPSFFLGTSPTASTATTFFYPLNGVPGGIPSLTNTPLPRSLYANFNQYVGGQPQSTRGNIYNRIEYKLTNKIHFFGEVSGYNSRSVVTREPTLLTVSDSRVSLAVDNPYNPYGSRFYSATGAPNADGTARLTGTPQAITIASIQFPAPEPIEAADNMYRVMAGFDGSIGQSTWNWETAALIGGVRALDLWKNGLRDSKLRDAGNRTDATAFNPFYWTFKVVGGQVVADAPYSAPKSVRDTYTMSGDRYGHSKLASYDARVTGDAVDLWAGPIATSIGVEWRYEFKENHYDPFVAPNAPGSGLDPNENDVLIYGPKPPFHGSRTIGSAYAEVVVPLANPKNKISLAQSLELNASVRSERYSDFGTTTKPKFGINWKPVPSVFVRASMNQGFRAPDMANLYLPTTYAGGLAPGTRDPVRNNYVTAAGLPPDTQIITKNYAISNPALQPENSKGLSAGIVVDVPWVKGLSFSVDYWEITQSNLIVSQGTTSGLDESLLRAYTQAQLAAGKDINSIDVGFRLTPDAQTPYVGDPYILRQAVTVADRALFAQTYSRLPQSQWIAPLGQWIGFLSSQINSGGKNFTNGFDYGVSYYLPRTRLGQFRFSTEWSEFLNKFTKSKVGLPKNDEIIAMVTAKWKGSANIQWRKAGWNATVSASYQTDFRTGATATAAQYAALNKPGYIKPVVVYNNTGVGTVNYYEVGKDQLQINAGIGYRFGPEANHWLRQTNFRVGINNLLDAEPAPASVSSTGYNGGTGSSLWVGRAFSFTVARDF